MTNNEQTLKQLKGKVLNQDEKHKVDLVLQAEPELWRTYGDLSIWTRNEVLTMIHPDTVQFKCTKVGIEQLRAQLLTEGDSDLEIIAIEQIITNYVQVAKTGYRLEKFDPEVKAGPIGMFWEKRHNQAQSRLMRSMNVLTRLRKVGFEMAIKKRKSRIYSLSLTANSTGEVANPILDEEASA